MSRPAPLRVAVLGAGTVGGPVVRAFLERPEKLAPFDGVRLVLAGVADKFVDRVVARGVPAEFVTDGPAHLVADPAVDVVVELMGGDGPAPTLIAAARAPAGPRSRRPGRPTRPGRPAASSTGPPTSSSPRCASRGAPTRTCSRKRRPAATRRPTRAATSRATTRSTR